MSIFSLSFHRKHDKSFDLPGFLGKFLIKDYFKPFVSNIFPVDQVKYLEIRLYLVEYLLILGEQMPEEVPKDCNLVFRRKKNMKT